MSSAIRADSAAATSRDIPWIEPNCGSQRMNVAIGAVGQVVARSS
jgi:hypothetical protein